MNIFVSYASKNRDSVQALVEDLELLDHAVWFDQDLSGGQVWWSRIIQFIQRCDVFVFALTPESLESYPCQLEYNYAQQLGKRILPVLLADIDTLALPPVLAQIQYVDYRLRDRKAALLLNRAFNALPPAAPLSDPLPEPPPAPISPLIEIKDRLGVPLLTMAEQEKLLSDLKKLLVDPDSTKNARALLERLKKRPDVAVSVFNDIDLVLRGVPTSVDVNPPAIPRPMNLGFEGPAMNKMPVGWFNSAGYVAGVSLAYQTHLTSRPGGICVIFQNLKAADDEFGSLMQRCPAYHLAGKVLRFEGEISTRDVVDRAGLWLRADGEMLGMELFFDNMWRRPIRGTTDWKTYTIEAQLPLETAWLNYGILLEGPGMVLADNFRLQVWDKDRWVDL